MTAGPRRRVARWTRISALAALYTGISAIFCAPLFQHPDNLGLFDWDQHMLYYGSVLKNIVEYGQAPFWNPWYCGGNVLWQNPQVALVSPAYPLASLMSLALAMKVNVVLHYVIGFAGMHLLLTQAIGLSSLPLVVFLSSVFVLSGALAQHVAVGHTVFLPAFFLPLLLFFVLRAFRTGSLRDAVVAGAVFAFTIYAGGMHVVPTAIVITGLTATVVTLLQRDWRPLALALAAGIVGAMCAAPRLIPSSLFATSDRFVDTRSESSLPDRSTPEIVWHTYFDADRGDPSRFPGQAYAWHEYGNYIGWPGGLAIVAGLLWALTRRRARDIWMGRALAITALALLIVSFGEFHPLAPAALLARLPLFSTFRIASRYTIGFVLCAVAAAGWAARDLEALLTTGRRRAIAAVLAAGAIAQIGWANHWHFEDLFRFDPVPTGFHLLARPGPPTYNLERNPVGAGSKMFRSLMTGEAFYNCYEPLQLRRGADPSRGLLIADGDVQLFKTTFSPNRVEFALVVGPAPATITLNENGERGWSTTAGPTTFDRRGRPSVVLPAGTAGTFAFSYRPPGLVVGVLVFAVGLTAAAWLWRRRSLY